MKMSEQVFYLEKIEAISRRQMRLVIVLMAGFLSYYALLLFGAAYFTKVFAVQISGDVNVGMLFTVSQYFMAGVIAWIYVKKMQAIDTDLNNLQP